MFAIAMTLPVTALEAPSIKPGESLLTAYVSLWPGYVSYALSCIVIGLYWAHSHFSGKIIKETDHGFNLLTILFLAIVSLTPFPSRPFVEHLSDPANNRIAASVYASVLAVPSVVWLLRWRYAVKREFLDERLAPDYLHSLTRKYTWTAVASLASALLCWFIDWRLGIGVGLAVILRYLLPPMTPKYKPGQEPKDELEEADEH